jgi:clan AA aspartic protease (TIGR02281 family)
MVYKCKNEQGKLLYQKTPCLEEKQAVTSWVSNTPVKSSTQESVKKNIPALVIPRGENGHYQLNGEVNSHGVNFIIDTGATVISLPRAVAASASLLCTDKIMMDTANGVSSGCTTTISELKVGEFVFTNVIALIVPTLDQPLLGMNVLQAFNIEQKNGAMTLSARESK